MSDAPRQRRDVGPVLRQHRLIPHRLRDTLQKLAHMLLVVDHTDGFHIQFLNDPT